MRKSVSKKDKYLISAYLICLIIFIFLYGFFAKQIKTMFFVTGFILLNIFISSYKKTIEFPIEIEVLTFGIVLCTIAYGVKAGLIVAILGGLLSSILYGYISVFLLPLLLGYILVAFMTPFFAFLNLAAAGIIITIIKNLFLFFFYHLVFSYDVGKNISFSVSNILVNLILFMNVAPFLVRVMV